MVQNTRRRVVIADDNPRESADRETELVEVPSEVARRPLSHVSGKLPTWTRDRAATASQGRLVLVMMVVSGPYE